MKRPLLIVSLLTALGLFVHWLSGLREDAKQESAEAARHVAEYFLRDFTTTTMDPQGRPEQRLAAELMQRYADDGSMELTEPRLTLYGETDNVAPWQIDAARGRISGDGKHVQLDGGVRMTRMEDNGMLELVTDDLLLMPKERYAETDAPLTVTYPQGRVDAVGLRAYMQDERLVLLAQVRGNYVPSH